MCMNIYILEACVCSTEKINGTISHLSNETPDSLLKGMFICVCCPESCQRMIGSNVTKLNATKPIWNFSNGHIENSCKR